MESSVAAGMTNVTKDYQLGKTTVHALRGVDLTIDNASFTVLHGPSGSGKSTVLNLLGCLDIASSGQLEIAGTDVASLSDKKRTHFRAHHIGFVFQNFNLIPVLTALENVEYPLQLIVPSRTERRRRAQEMLDAVGLGTKSGRRPAELSGGERQRVAVARAMVKQPSLLLADEPTANLDRRTGADLLKLMRQMQRTSNTTFVFSSHDPQLIEDADAKIHIEDGQVLNAQKTAPVAQG